MKKAVIILTLVLLVFAHTSCASRETSPQSPEKTAYSLEYADKIQFSTYDTVEFAMTLGKGDYFEAKLILLKANKKVEAIPLSAGSIIFWVNNMYGQKILDAGRIEESYSFNFTAVESGDYQLVFQRPDKNTDCIIIMSYNSPGPLRDVTVR